jgi:hypothetical protein
VDAWSKFEWLPQTGSQTSVAPHAPHPPSLQKVLQIAVWNSPLPQVRWVGFSWLRVGAYCSALEQGCWSRGCWLETKQAGAGDTVDAQEAKHYDQSCTGTLSTQKVVHVVVRRWRGPEPMAHFAQRLKRAFLDDEGPVQGGQNDGQAVRTFKHANGRRNHILALPGAGRVRMANQRHANGTGVNAGPTNLIFPSG